MKQKTFNEKLEVVYLWMDIADLHWERILGEFWGDKQFWEDLFHSMDFTDWEYVLDVAKGIQAVHSELLQPFPKFAYNLEQLERRLNKRELVIKKYDKRGHNTAPVSVFMTLRDVLNEMNNQPTRRWTDKQRAKILAEKEISQFDTLFERT